MNHLGTETNPIRVGIVGAGPAGFYTADFLLRSQEPKVQVDMYDSLPTPFGLVRSGVAPDHQKIKAVTRVFDRVARRPTFRFFGNTHLGTHVRAPELADFYHALIYATGAQTDRDLHIPGHDLQNSHAATEFVAWYNGHPDFQDRQFDLAQEGVAVIGVGNVAVDVARILAHTHASLAQTDIADQALAHLRTSRIRNIYILGRRGPAQAAFTVPEVRELGELPGCDTFTLPTEVALDPASAAYVEQANDRALNTKLKILREFAQPRPTSKPRRLTIRFLTSPVELIGDDAGRVKQMRLVHNELYADDNGTLRSRATDQFEVLDVGLVFRSIGYYGVPLPDVPFRTDWGIIPNHEGQVTDPDTGQPIAGHYVTGWIKRGPSGVIGTNRPDAKETVDHLLTDVMAGRHLYPVRPDPDAVMTFVKERQPRMVTYEDWLRLDALETARGEAEGRPRVKFTSVESMLAAIEAADDT